MEPTKQATASIEKHVEDHIAQGWDYDKLKQHIEEDFPLGKWEALQYLELNQHRCGKKIKLETIQPKLNRQQRRLAERKKNK